MKKQYKVGIYCRLSVDDASNSAKAKNYIPGDESASIENQYEILSKFVMLNGWIEVKTYRDDGYSGGNFQRPGFLEMLEDARHGLINLILVKDLSRLGRDFVEVGRYTDVIFPSLGCRFVSVLDCLDSEGDNTDSQAIAQNENAMLDKLKQQILSESAAKQEDTKLEISRLRRRIEELEHMTAKLYEDKVSGVIDGDTFAVLIQKSEQERIQKAERLEVLLAEEQKVQQEVENIQQWAGIVRRYLNVQELDREIVEELIDHIEIGERSIIDGQRQQDIKIFYRFVGVV